MRRQIQLIFGLAVLISLSFGCSTKKNTAFSRFWHNMNTHYNGYFNGNEAIKEGMAMLNDSRKDDFTKIIPTFEYGDQKNWSNMNTQADRAIKKAVIMIKKHSMFINGKQYNKWIDDCYLLLGKANFFKLEHSLGVNQLKHVVRNSEKKYTQYEAKIWMMRTYNEMGEYAESGTVMRGVDVGSMSPKLQPEFFAVVADMYIRQKDWERALINLDEAIIVGKNKKRNARLEFIKGQIYVELGENKKAYESFARVLKSKPEYVLDFQSRIHMAKTAEGANNQSIRKTLNKMLKDGKNLEYLDQVYYAIALIDLKEEKTEDAIDHLNQSLRNSVDNTNQQGLTHLTLAELYMDSKKYRMAQGYYDSASVTLAQDHPKYDEVIRIRDNLTMVVENIEIVETQDSLLKLGEMDSLSLVSYFEDYIEQLKILDEEAKNNPNTNPVNFNATQNSGTWYFVNNQAMVLGSNDFKKVWGNRPLEDDWRRENKASSFLADDPQDTSNTDQGENPRYMVETYITQVPLREPDKKASREKIYNALYTLGTIYKDKILDYKKSAEAYEDLISRCPKTYDEYYPITYFQLFNVYNTLNNTAKRDEYKNIILTEYPNSDYAQLILNPELFASKNEKNDAAEPSYIAAYDLYKSGAYVACMDSCGAAMVSFKGSSLLHRFALLQALCVDYVNGRDTFKLALKAVIKNYKGTESATTAQRLLDYMDGKSDGSGVETLLKPEFKAEPNAEHFVIIYLPDEKKKLDAAIGKMNEFNDKEFPLKGYKITNVLLPESGQVMLVRKFGSKTEAMLYIEMYDKREMVFKIQFNTPSKIMAITANNFATLSKVSSMAEYQTFYGKNYKE